MRQTTKKKITSLKQFPDFDKMTLQEEATWWETHDLSEIWDQLGDIELKIEPDAFKVPRHLRQLTNAINVRLDPTDLQNLRVIANRKGLGIATLARMWILENIYSGQKDSHVPGER